MITQWMFEYEFLNLIIQNAGGILGTFKQTFKQTFEGYSALVCRGLGILDVQLWQEFEMC